MHPYQHAQSSFSKLGGDFQVHLNFHNWIDKSKIISCDPRHRYLRHHKEGLDCAQKHFKINDNKISQIHLLEDFKKDDITAFTWISMLDKNIKYPQWNIDAVQDYAKISKSHETIANWLLEPMEWAEEHPAWPMFRAHSFGCFEAEDLFGCLTEDGIPTRILAEQFIRRLCRKIITPESWIQKIQKEKWMSLSLKTL